MYVNLCINNLRKNKWGDYFEIFTLSNYLRLNIQIIKIDRNTFKFMNSIIIPYEDSNKTYTLLLIDDFHYMAVI